MKRLNKRRRKLLGKLLVNTRLNADLRRYAANRLRKLMHDREKTTVIPFPTNAMIELGNVCNLHCMMCPREFVYGKEMDKGFNSLTTKFYEALGCEKPVLCVPSDKGALAELIAYTNAGIATEDSEKIKNFILTHYEAWKKNGCTRQATQHREEFTRNNQYDQFYRTYL